MSALPQLKQFSRNHICPLFQRVSKPTPYYMLTSGPVFNQPMIVVKPSSPHSGSAWIGRIGATLNFSVWINTVLIPNVLPDLHRWYGSRWNRGWRCRYGSAQPRWPHPKVARVTVTHSRSFLVETAAIKEAIQWPSVLPDLHRWYGSRCNRGWRCRFGSPQPSWHRPHVKCGTHSISFLVVTAAIK